MGETSGVDFEKSTIFINFVGDKLFHAIVRYGKVTIDVPEGIRIPEGVTVLVGDNGSGKTTFANILAKGRHAFGNNLSFLREGMKIKMISFSDIHTLSGLEAQYYAQRMEATMNDLVPTVALAVGKNSLTPEWRNLCDAFGLKGAEDKKVNYLSSGELRKVLVVNALVSRPHLLILDNPYIGLDAPSRAELDATLASLPARGTSVLMLIADASEIPDYADAVMTMENCRVTGLYTSAEDVGAIRQRLTVPDASENLRLPLTGRLGNMPHEISFSIRSGHARYGDKEIFSGIDWTVRKGERWVLQGPNGSGKSLLLSMVCADNPQGYANDIILFDRRRGSGESIWEIKDAIGFVSPEMQRFYKSDKEVGDIMVQGMRNTLNRYKPATESERSLAAEWMDTLGISHLARRKFQELSDGEQRLVLLGAAFVRQPSLLVLDEPLHGLDRRHKQRVLQIVDRLTAKQGASLIYVTHDAAEIRPDYRIFRLR